MSQLLILFSALLINLSCNKKDFNNTDIVQIEVDTPFSSVDTIFSDSIETEVELISSLENADNRIDDAMDDKEINMGIDRQNEKSNETFKLSKTEISLKKESKHQNEPELIPIDEKVDSEEGVVRLINEKNVEGSEQSINLSTEEVVSSTLEEEITPVKEKEEVIFPTQMDLWHSILTRYVSSEGVVDYSGLKTAELKLDEYLVELKENVPSRTDKSKKAKAFWINAYNAYTVKLILKNFPLGSIREIDNGKPWDTKWIDFGNKKYSLNNIEHDILRVLWNDGRIHFAVNCAAKSCPSLSNESFTSENIDEQLTELTQKFINNDNFNQISSTSLRLSKIFDWYKEDFGDLVQFVDKYTSVKVNANAKVAYNDYDWSLNGK